MYTKAVELAQSLELAAQNVKELKVKPEGRDPIQPNPRQEVYKLASSSSRELIESKERTYLLPLW